MKCPNPDCFGGKLREKFPGRVQYINDCPVCKGTGEVPAPPPSSPPQVGQWDARTITHMLMRGEMLPVHKRHFPITTVDGHVIEFPPQSMFDEANKPSLPIYANCNPDS